MTRPSKENINSYIKLMADVDPQMNAMSPVFFQAAEALAAEVVALRAVIARVRVLAGEWSDELDDRAPWSAADDIFEALGEPRRGHPYGEDYR